MNEILRDKDFRHMKDFMMEERGKKLEEIRLNNEKEMKANPHG